MSKHCPKCDDCAKIVARTSYGGFRLFSAGINDDGQLGDRSTVWKSIPSPIFVAGALRGKRVIKIISGDTHTLALTADGLVYAWGSNTFGQLGIPSVSSSTVPLLIPGLSNIIGIAAGYQHSIAFDSLGNTYAWGSNTVGQLGTGDNTSSPIPILTLIVAPPVIPVSIVTNDSTNIMITATGTVYTWGDNSYGQLGSGIVGGSSNTLVTPTMPFPDPYVSVALTQRSAAAASSNGRVAVWGTNDLGQLGIGNTLPSYGPMSTDNTGVLNGVVITKLAAGSGHVLALSNTGNLYGWGDGVLGQLANGLNAPVLLPIAIAFPGQTISSISAGSNASAAITSTGKLYGWGSNDTGQFANGDLTDTNVPIIIYRSLANRTIQYVIVGSDYTSIITN
jgi:alpha-tubulin suppressor-like RCC1 family protein